MNTNLTCNHISLKIRFNILPYKHKSSESSLTIRLSNRNSVHNCSLPCDTFSTHLNLLVLLTVIKSGGGYTLWRSSLNNIIQLIFITVKCSVSLEVWTEFLNIIYMSLGFKRLKIFCTILCISASKGFKKSQPGSQPDYTNTVLTSFC
jgi:hypothetical protein